MNKPISNTTTRNRLTGWLSQLMVFAAVVAVSIVSDWVPHRAIAAQANVQAFVDQQRMVLARDARIAAVSDRLEEIAEQLRWIRPQGAQTPNLEDVQALTGDRAPLAVADRVLSEFDQLGDFEAQIEADWNAETQSMRERGIPAVVVDRQVELLAEVRARAAQFRTRIAALRAEVARSSVSGTSSELIELADWLDPQQHARGYQAIEAAQLPLQLADAERTPAPGAVPTSDADKVAAAKAFTDPPTPADLAPTLDAPFTPAIQALAAELNNDPVAIRSWVYNNIEFQPTFGSIQGADLTLLNRSGNAHDIASLTIALLRSAGTPARYVKSVVELPVEQVQNWLGDLATPQMALDLLQKGGVPAGAVIVASRIKAIQFEHVWVEAYVDFIPSRARLNRVPDQWVPLDVAFKQYDYQPAVPWRQMSLNARQNAVVDFANQLTLDGTGGLSGFDFDRFDRSITNIAEQLAVDLPAAYPGMDVEDFYDQREIHQIDSLIIAGTLPFPLRSATVLRYSELPANARHVLSVKFYADQTSLNYDSPTRQVTIETVRLGTQRLQADYAPATPADAQAIAQYVSDNATTIPLGQLSVVPRLRLGDELLFQSGNGRMGQLHFWKTDTRDVHGNQTSTEAYRFPAGSQIVFVANLAGMSGARVEREHQGLPDFGRFAMADGLYYGGTLYWMMHDNLDDQAARSVGGRALRIPSVGSFATNLQVRYFFGVPRTGFTTGQITDVKAVGLALALPNAEDLAPTALHIGAAGSMSESASWALLAGTGGIGLGASTATLLKAAMDEGQRLFQIKQSNVDVALAELQLSADAENEIRSAVAGGLIVVAHEREVQYRNWSGAGYVIYSPTTGASLQRIEGGFAGGLEFGCIARAVALELLCSSKILAIAQRFLLGFAARLAGRALALAGLGALFAAVAPAAAVILPILSAVVTIISIAMAVAEVIKWVRGIIDGSETLTEDELIQLGIDSINELACSYGPPCLPFAGEALNALGIGGPTQSTEDERGMGGPTVGNPVAVGTGAKWQVERDFDGAGPFPLHFVRTYISQVPKSGGLIGVKWSASYFQSVKLPPSIEGGPYPVEERPDRVLLRRPDGSYYQFDWRTDAYVADANIPGTLERLTSGTNTAAWEYTTPQDTVEHYDAQGRLQYIRHRAGLTHTVSHDEYQRPIKVTDSYGRELNFTYSEETAYLETMTDPVGRVTHYQHDEFGNLTQVRYQDDSTRTYHYEDLSNRFGLTGITDERNIRVSTWAYDHKGRVLSYHRAGDVDQHTFEYAKNQTTVTDPLGTVRTYEYESIFDRPYIKQVTQPCSVCGAGDVSETTYDSRGLIATRKDFRNAETRYTRNSRGLVESMTEAVGTPVSRITRTQWHPDYYLPTRMEDPITGGSRVTEFFYDGEGNLTDKTVTTPEEVRQWSFTYNANGQRTGADGPRSDVVDTMAYTYHPDGTLATRVDAVGNQWDYTDYDADGQLRRMVDPNGLVTTYRYDDRQRLTEINEDNEITAFGYDAAGNLTRITLPDSSYIEYVFDDAERISEVRDNLGHRLVYQLDGQGNRMVEERFDRNGNLLQTMRRVYDGIGRLKEHYGAEDQLTEYGYDPNNNQTSVRDPNQLLTQHRYDPLNRLDQTINPLLGEIEFAYDAQDNLTQVSDPRDVTTTYAYNGFDELTRLTSPDTGITDYDYDPAGNLLSRTDARGVEATYQYDAENRLTQIDYPAHNGQPAETLSFSYDDSSNGNSGRGRLTAISDGSGNTRFTYDSHGRVTAKTQTVGGGSARTLQTSYLANGRLEGHVLPSGAVCRYSYRADGRVLSISVNGVEIVSEIDYFAFGEIRSWDYGNSGQYRREFDQDGRIREHSAGSASRSIGFDPASRITAIADNSGARHNWSFDYDDLDRLSSAQNSASQGPVAGTDLLWDYDPTGNRTSQTNAGTPLSYSIDPNSNRLLQVGANARQYDEVGNTVNDGNGITSTYSPRNRLVQTSNAGLSTTYAHNGFGERVCKAIDSSQACASSTGRIEYVYDDSGHLIGEYPVGGSTAQAVEYVWLDDTPIAVLQRRPGSTNGGGSGGGTATAWNGTAAGGVDVYYLHPDHLDTPRVVVNAQNQEIWRWDASPFGDTLADEQPTGGLPSYTHNLRFPGQQYDRETGAHYNYFRDYEAGSGRYLQSDPIGLDFGNFSNFSYVESDVLGKFDLSGEKSKRKSKSKKSKRKCSARNSYYPTRARKSTITRLGPPTVCAICGKPFDDDRKPTIGHSPISLVEYHNTIGFNTTQEARNDAFNNLITRWECQPCQASQGGKTMTTYRTDHGPSFRPRRRR